MPKPGRLVLMDQDITHAVSAPNAEAGSRPRYSLVCKLVLHPHPVHSDSAEASAASVVRLVHPQHGAPTALGSAAHGPSSSEI